MGVMGEMAVLDSTGDTKIIWDSSKPDEVDAARAMFETLTKKGYRAFSVKKNGDTDKIVSEFDPTIEKLIMVPRIVGG